MTTAARPTFDTAKGGSSRSEKSLSSHSKQYSARDLPGHTKLKYRQSGQGTEDENKTRDFRRELEERELKAKQTREGKRDWELESPDIVEPKKLRIEDFAKLDADEKLDYDDEDSSDDDDDEDDTEALMAELNKIKAERAAEEAKKQQEKEAEENRIRTENILSANPLLQAGGSGSGSFTVRRRWDDDVVFKNCAKGEKLGEKRGFVNDTLRSEFHKKFMDRYIK